MKSISVFFPAHNEEQNIGKMVQDSVSYLETTGRDYEVITVADHCTDKTADIVREIAAQNSRVRVVENDKDAIAGYGGALRKGFASCTKELVFFTDSDLQFNIKELSKLFKYIDKYDYVIGYRINRQDPAYRSLNAKAYNILVRIMLGVKVKDLDCAFKLFRKEIIDSIDIKTNSALINAEILFKLNQKGYKFKEVGVHHYERKYGKPTGANIKVILRTFRDLGKLKVNKLI